MNGMQSQAPMFMINFHKVDEESDYVAHVSRLRKFDTAFDQLPERGRASSASDISPPKFAYEGVIDQSRKVISGRSEEHQSALQSIMTSSYAVFCLKTTTTKYSN